MTKQLKKVEEKGIKERKTSLTDRVLSRIDNLKGTGLRLPRNYSAENAIRFAELSLVNATVPGPGGKRVLDHCTPESIANALLEMVTKGLNVSKNQCYLIPYGNKLECVTSYFGEVTIAKRAGLVDVKAVTIHSGDVFEFEINVQGKKNVTKHIQTLESLDTEIIGAYSVIEKPDGSSDTDIMTMKEIKQSWLQSPTKGNSPAHRNFHGEMSKRTVINRSVKMFVNTSDDTDLYIGNDYLGDPVDADVTYEIETNANKTEIGFDDASYEIVEEEKQELATVGKEPSQQEAILNEPGF